jgi:uncharacterized protein (TIGR03435 family)
MPRTVFTAALALTAAFGQSAPPAFEVASVRPIKSSMKDRRNMSVAPGRITYANVSLQDCIRAAYGVRSYQISGPGWIDTERYDIAAKAAEGAAEPALMQMLQSLLAERFQLKLHRETKELGVYSLVAAKGGPKLQEADAKAPASMNLTAVPGAIVFQNYTTGGLAEVLSGPLFRLERPVVDQTGLGGVYNFTLKLADSIADLKRNVAEVGDGPAIFAVLQDQAGLRLAPQKAPVEILVVDHAERAPAEN